MKAINVNRRRTALVVGASLGVMLYSPIRAEFVVVHLQDVPVDRIIRNLEEVASQAPSDVQSRFNLARVHSMAYALKRESLPIRNDRIDSPGSDAWPFSVVAPATRADTQTASVHLDQALVRYREVLKLDPDYPFARLGYAWCLDQAGKTVEAIEAYRDVIREAWPRERDLTHAGVGWRSITAETAGYLIRLLDPDRDKDEIASIQERIAQMAKVPRAITPIVVPLRDGVNAADLIDSSAHVLFDADGTGIKKPWTWINKNAGWLVFNPRNADVTSTLQMFGTVTFWLFWDNGYEAMRALDDNGDGMLSGHELAGLCIWQDRNSDGMAQSLEMKSVDEWGIISLSVAYQRDQSDAQSVAFAPAGATFVGGRTRPTYDIILYPHCSPSTTGEGWCDER